MSINISIDDVKYDNEKYFEKILIHSLELLKEGNYKELEDMIKCQILYSHERQDKILNKQILDFIKKDNRK